MNHNKHLSPYVTTRMVKLCELCGAQAHLHCEADSAYLCRSCDAKFHASNFLFSRHVRRIICPDCNSLTGDCVSGPLSSWPPRITCSCCGTSSSCCSSLDFISTSELSSSTTRKTIVREKRVKAVADGIFVNWCSELGLKGDLRNGVVSLASFALAVWKPRAAMTTKVVLAAAFWFGVRNLRKKVTWTRLESVEDVTGVAAGTIRAVERKLARAVTVHLRRCRVESEEGWGENDNV